MISLNKTNSRTCQFSTTLRGTHLRSTEFRGEHISKQHNAADCMMMLPEAIVSLRRWRARCVHYRTALSPSCQCKSLQAGGPLTSRRTWGRSEGAANVRVQLVPKVQTLIRLIQVCSFVLNKQNCLELGPKS